MSPAMSALATYGITQQVLIVCVLALVTAGVIGLFWHYILPGAIILGVAALFYVAPEAPTPTTIESTSTKVEEKTEEVFDEYQAYMKDCIEVANYSMFECKNLWNNRGEKHSETPVDFKPAAEVKLVDVDNVEYKERRAAALKKPGAVVMQATYR